MVPLAIRTKTPLRELVRPVDHAQLDTDGVDTLGEYVLRVKNIYISTSLSICCANRSLLSSLYVLYCIELISRNGPRCPVLHL